MKIYFKTKKLFFIILVPIVYCFFGMLLYFFILSGETFGIIILIIIMLLVIMGMFFGSIYGFKINDNSIRIVSQQRIKRFKIKDIEKIEITFRKEKENYSVFAYVFVKSKDPVYFVWDYIYVSKGPSIRYNITDKNINRYLDKLAKFNYFNVRVER